MITKAALRDAIKIIEARYPAPDGEPLPKVKVGAIFLWRGQMYRRGVGILYRARPVCRGTIYESYRRRDRRRAARFARRLHRGEQR